MIPAIPEKVFFKIGEVADIINVEQHVLRYWEEEFDALKPLKNKSGQRMYQRKDLDLILEIKRLLYEEKYTIAGAIKQLKNRPKKPAQLEFGFDREKALELKENIKMECKSILNIINKKSK